MKVLPMVLSSLSVLMMLATLICGAWLRSTGADPGGAALHLKLAVPTAVLTLITLAVLISRVAKG
ncbi:MAG TPA: hypothetical protein VFF68_11045 [Anaerolineaceae bacterium]|nr:hypothetical protein [Anaerolineaceae bacterium]